MEGKPENLRSIVNQRLVILNSRLGPHDVEMYSLTGELRHDHVRRMVSDLDWVMESVEPETGQDSPVYRKYTDVRERLIELHECLDEESAQTA